MPARIIYKPGQKLNSESRLKYIRDVEPISNGKRRALFLCDCENEAEIQIDSVKYGNTLSCGCFKVESNTTHGLGQHALYHTWYEMIKRCYSPEHKQFADYGDRGILVCSEWLDSPKQFIEDMGEKPTPEHSIDRIDNDGTYCPENCKWSTPTEQSHNRRLRKTNKSGYAGVFENKSRNKWQVSIRANGKLICVGYFTDKNEAIAARTAAELKYWGKIIA